MVKRKVINQVKLGVYIISNKEAYKPYISDKLAQLSKIVAKVFDKLDYCLWSTEWLNDFTQHQLGTFHAIQGSKMDMLFENGLERYHINFSKEEEIKRNIQKMGFSDGILYDFKNDNTKPRA